MKREQGHFSPATDVKQGRCDPPRLTRVISKKNNLLTCSANCEITRHSR